MSPPSTPGLSGTRPALFALLLAVASGVRAGLFPTEIYYNGPLAGADRDEYLELTNASAGSLVLSGFSFSQGIGFTFPSFVLPPGQSLILAPDTTGFLERFPGFAGTLFDVSGGLSNGGETITLLDAAGSAVFSFGYDDTAAWPQAADGDGASLELAGPALALSNPDSWLAAPPDPGRWRYLPRDISDASPPGNPVSVPVPPAGALFATGLLFLVHRRRAAPPARPRGR